MGTAWYLLKGGYYSAIAVLVGSVVIPAGPGVARPWPRLLLACCLLAADFLPFNRAWGVSLVDEGIDRIGYLVSRLSPPQPHDDPTPPGPKPVLSPMTQLVAHTPEGEITIASGHGLLRTYSWEGATRSLELIPPSRDLYGEQHFHTRHDSPDGERTPAYDWQEFRGIVRGEAWESEQHFQTLNEAEAWLQKENDPALPLVWTNDGLVVGWSKRVDYKALTVVVHQIFVNGRKPTQLAGSQDSLVSVKAVSAE